MKMKMVPERNSYKLARLVICGALAYLCLAWVLSYLVDVQTLNILGLKEFIHQVDPEAPLLWVHLFKEAALTESLQWIFLGISMFLVVVYVIIRYSWYSRCSWEWILLLVGLYAIYLEDVLNLRHTLTAAVASSVFDIETATVAWRTSMLKSLMELGLFLILGIVMVVALVVILKDDRENPLGKKYLVTGYIFYGIAAVFSGTRNIGDWYAPAGRNILDFLVQGKEVTWSGDCEIFFSQPLGFWFMDLVVGESIVLMGAAFILAGLIIFVTPRARAFGMKK